MPILILLMLSNSLGHQVPELITVSQDRPLVWVNMCMTDTENIWIIRQAVRLRYLSADFFSALRSQWYQAES